MYLISVMLQAMDGGVTIGDIIADLPRDPAAILLYVLTALSLYLIWAAHRNKPEDGPQKNSTATTEEAGQPRRGTGDEAARAESERQRS